MDMFFAYTARQTFIIDIKFFQSFTKKKKKVILSDAQFSRKRKAYKELIKEKKTVLKITSTIKSHLD